VVASHEPHEFCTRTAQAFFSTKGLLNGNAKCRRASSCGQGDRSKVRKTWLCASTLVKLHKIHNKSPKNTINKVNANDYQATSVTASFSFSSSAEYTWFCSRVRWIVCAIFVSEAAVCNFHGGMPLVKTASISSKLLPLVSGNIRNTWMVIAALKTPNIMYVFLEFSALFIPVLPVNLSESRWCEVAQSKVKSPVTGSSNSHSFSADSVWVDLGSVDPPSRSPGWSE